MAFPTSLTLCSHKNISFTIHNRNDSHIKKRPTLIPTQKINLSSSSNPKTRITHFSKEKKSTLQKVLVEKAVTFIAGSVLFAGFFFGLSRKPAISVVPNQSESSETRKEEQEQEEEEEEEDEEVGMYERLLEREPENVEALKVVLHGKMRRGKTKEAVKFVERLAHLEPQEVEWRLLKALCTELMGDLSEAKSLFVEVLKEKPLLLRALHGLALVMHKNGEGEAVFVMLNKALEIARRKKRVTEERNIKILMAQMRVVRGELEDGLKGFKALVEEDYRDFRPYLCLGIIYSLQDKKKEADEQFEIYRSLVPEEFPQRNFLDDVVIAAKTKSQEQLKQEFQNEYATTSK